MLRAAIPTARAAPCTYEPRVIAMTLRKLTFITVEEAARLLGLSASTIYNRRGGTEKLTRVKLGKAVRLLLEEVEEHAAKRIAAGRRESGRL